MEVKHIKPVVPTAEEHELAARWIGLRQKVSREEMLAVYGPPRVIRVR